MKKYYITTTLPYVNADPHIGFALEIVQADVLARYHRLLGEAMVFNTGTDEHGLKIYEKAAEEGLNVQDYVDDYAGRFDRLKEGLNLSYTHFIRTTDPEHIAAAQEFWRLCDTRGDIYKKSYQVKYCVGCELEKTDSELEDGICPLHPGRAVELIDEENYFFAFSKYEKKLLALYRDTPSFVVPEHRQKEITNFVEAGLQDFSISRLKAKMPWGVPVPNDDDHVMYVWFDALINYISTLGWPCKDGGECLFDDYWPGVQVAGKDNLRQQSAMWQAMLMSAGIAPSHQIFIHGFITADGAKMSKSAGNVIDPFAVVEKYGADALRFYLLGALPSYEDGDWSSVRFEEYYTAHLANGVGNLTSRILSMLKKYADSKIPAPAEDCFVISDFWKKYSDALARFQFDAAVGEVNALVARLDRLISAEKPWERSAAGEDICKLLYQLAEGLRHIALALLPIIPESAEKILTGLGFSIKGLSTLEEQKKWGKLQEGAILIHSEGVLFPRL